MPLRQDGQSANKECIGARNGGGAQGWALYRGRSEWTLIMISAK